MKDAVKDVLKDAMTSFIGCCVNETVKAALLCVVGTLLSKRPSITLRLTAFCRAVCGLLQSGRNCGCLQRNACGFLLCVILFCIFARIII